MSELLVFFLELSFIVTKIHFKIFQAVLGFVKLLEYFIALIDSSAELFFDLNILGF